MFTVKVVVRYRENVFARFECLLFAHIYNMSQQIAICAALAGIKLRIVLAYIYIYIWMLEGIQYKLDVKDQSCGF